MKRGDSSILRLHQPRLAQKRDQKPDVTRHRVTRIAQAAGFLGLGFGLGKGKQRRPGRQCFGHSDQSPQVALAAIIDKTEPRCPDQQSGTAQGRQKTGNILWGE